MRYTVEKHKPLFKREPFTTDVAGLRGNTRDDMQDQPSGQTNPLLSLMVAPKSASWENYNSSP